MRQAAAILYWIYDFLAEDVVILVGAAIAVAVTVFVARANHNAAGFVLWAMVIASIAVSLSRVVFKRS
ncbi:MAG TPA: hypothetical protein VFB34_02670 [Chloroflexota bacterium]|nr:hypothetical protein [Chloroflexota bacterium]